VKGRTKPFRGNATELKRETTIEVGALPAACADVCSWAAMH
jgi:hypothetical protein